MLRIILIMSLIVTLILIKVIKTHKYLQMWYYEVHAHIDIWQQEPTEMEEKENNNKTQNKKQIN